MTALRTLLALGLLLLPCAAGAEECQVVEFPDHFEAVCIGDAKPYSIPKADIAVQTGRGADPAPGETLQPQEASLNPGGSAGAASGNPGGSAAVGGIEPARAPEPGATGAVRRGRQGRPSTADLNAVLEARRRLIQQSTPQSTQQ